MKKQYLTPAITEHKLRVESHILANTILKHTEFGNKYQNTTAPDEPKVLVPDVEQGIGTVEGNDIGNI